MTTPGLYRHYKGTLYRVIGIARDSTNGPGEGRRMVIYFSDAEHGLHVRDEAQFEEEINDTVEGGLFVQRRFERVGD